MTKQECLQKYIDESNNIVFFGGAGVSTESGIPDFRSENGLYINYKKNDPEKILSYEYFMENTEKFYNFYRSKLVYQNATPNYAHKKLMELERAGKLKAVITQNIDGLHQAAGCTCVLELHGSIYRNTCMDCKKKYKLRKIMMTDEIPKCKCGGIIKPDVVLYGESLDQMVINRAILALREADLLIIAGTSLNVYPASGLIDHYKGKRIVVINKEQTRSDQKAQLVINDSIGYIMSKIKVEIKEEIYGF